MRISMELLNFKNISKSFIQIIWKSAQFTSELPESGSPAFGENIHKKWTCVGISIHKKCATLKKAPTPGLTVKMKQDITGTIQKFPAQPFRNPFE